MGRGGAKGRERGSLPSDHWTYRDPDRELWSPSQLAQAQQVPSRRVWDALYGGTPVSLIDFHATRLNPQTREAAREALRLYKSGDAGELLAIVRQWGEPEWGEGSPLEDLYQRAFVHTAKSEAKADGHKLLQKDEAMDLLMKVHLQSFYQSLQDAAMSRIPEARALGEDWAGVVMRSPESELGGQLREQIATQPLSRVPDNLVRGIVRLGDQPELQESFEREISLRMENVVEEAPFWSRDNQADLLGQGVSDPDIYRLQYGANPLLHIKDPQRGYGTLCGAQSGYGVRRGAWATAAFKRRRCRKCEKALLDGSGDEIEHLRERLAGGGNSHLPLPLLEEAERENHYKRIADAASVRSALGSLAGLDPSSPEEARGEITAIIIEENAATLSDLEDRRCQEIDKEMSQASEEEQRQITDRKWRGWRTMLDFTHERILRSSGDWGDDEALSQIFSASVKREVISLYSRQAAERARGEHDSATKLGNEIGEVVRNATEGYLDSKLKEQRKSEKSDSPRDNL